MQNVGNMNLTRLVGSDKNYQPVQKKYIPDSAVVAINYLFSQLRAIFPAWKTSFPNKESYQTAKRVWLEALVSEGITTVEQLENGITQAQKETNPFFPSVGQFIEWCNHVDYHSLGLPDESELMQRINQFMGYARHDKHLFKYRSKAEYWLLLNTYQSAWNKQEKDLVLVAKEKLKEASELVIKGFDFPDIPVMVESKDTKCNPEVAQKYISKMRAGLKKVGGYDG